MKAITRAQFASAMAIGVSASFLLCGYEFLRSISQSLYIGAYGAARLPLVMALGPLGTLAMIYGYGRLLSWAGAKRAMMMTTVLSGAIVLGCYAAIRAESRMATAVLYVFREAYIVLLVEQVWAFINSTVSQAGGRRLNGPICGIASLGAVTGGLLVQRFAVAVGSANLLVVGAATLVPTGLCAVLAYHWGGEPQPSPEEAGGRHGHLGASVLLQNRTLSCLALLIVATQIVSTVLDLQLSRYVELAVPIRDERTRWFGGFYAQLNVASALFQFVVTPLLLRYVSARPVQVAIPIIHVLTCVACVVSPALIPAAAAYATFKVLDYSLFRATKELLYIPLSYDARYRAKELIDAFLYRFAKGGASLALAAVGRFTAIPMATYPGVALAVLLGWLPLAVRLTRGSGPAGKDPASPRLR